MNTLAPALMLAAFCTTPVIYFFTHLPFEIVKLDPPQQYPIEYSKTTGEPLSVNIKDSVISFEEYISKVGRKTLTRAEVRKTLQEYLEPRLVIYHRTPPKGSEFSTEWKHTSSLVVSKTVKDLVLVSKEERFTPEMID